MKGIEGTLVVASKSRKYAVEEWRPVDEISRTHLGILEPGSEGRTLSQVVFPVQSDINELAICFFPARPIVYVTVNRRKEPRRYPHPVEIDPDRAASFLPEARNSKQSQKKRKNQPGGQESAALAKFGSLGALQRTTSRPWSADNR